MARAKDVAKLLRGGVNDKTSPARLAEIMKALRHAEIAKGITPEKLVSLLEELGPTFIKLGQILSARRSQIALRQGSRRNKGNHQTRNRTPGSIPNSSNAENE